MLTPRWYNLRYHKEQQRLWNSTARFRVVPAGRRSGKTELAKRFIVKQALRHNTFSDAWFICAAPTREQAKRIFWKDLKALSPFEFIAHTSESELSITYINGARLSVLGLEKPERAEGNSLSGAILDEYGNMNSDVWPEHVRPSLSDRNGFAWFTGVPEGRNHYYDLSLKARVSENWDVFHWFSEDILPPEEIAEAKNDLDPLTYRQEYRGEFVTFAGLAYYGWSEENALKLDRPKYDPNRPLMLCFDFNVSPGVCAAIQEFDDATYVVGEVYIPQYSNTPMVCEKAKSLWAARQAAPVHLYGDASGGAKGTAKVAGSDWDLIRASFEGAWKGGFVSRVQRANPPVRSRVNSVNTRLCNANMQRRLFVDARRAPNVIKDFEGVKIIEGSNGEIDKSDPKFTHITDAIGYYIDQAHPCGGSHRTVVEQF